MTEDMTTARHFDKKWREVIKQMPQGGDYCFYMRQYGYDIIKNVIKEGSYVFDYACGLAIIDKQLSREKACFCFGCDISKVAIEYAGKEYGHPENFNICSEIGQLQINEKGEIKNIKYDYILAIYFIEHIPDPVGWLNNALEYGKKVIFSIPNNFKQAGEHVLMAWHDWPSFYEIFENLKLTRIDEGKYHKWLPEAYHHPTFVCEKK